MSERYNDEGRMTWSLIVSRVLELIVFNPPATVTAADAAVELGVENITCLVLHNMNNEII